MGSKTNARSGASSVLFLVAVLFGSTSLFLPESMMSAAATTTTADIPESLELSESLKASIAAGASPSLYDATLILLEFASQSGGPFEASSSGLVKENPTAWTLQDAAVHHAAGAAATIIFVETNVDDLGLLEFHQDYFPFSLYRDAELTTYHAMGNRWIDFNPFRKSWNPFTIWKDVQAMARRNQNITGNLQGDGLVLGGLLILEGATGTLRFAYDEDAGDALPMEDIQAVIDVLVEEQQQQQQQQQNSGETAPETETAEPDL